MSAWEMMPTSLCPSMTGRRRTCSLDIVRSASSMESSAPTVTVLASPTPSSPARVVFRSLPCAIAFTTLDNVAEDPHLWSGPFFTDETGAFNWGVLERADSMLLGRVTYEGFAAAWPSRSGDPFSDKFNSMPKYVVSSTLERGEWNPTTVISGDDPYPSIRELREKENVLIWGSPTLVQGLLDEGLVDELVLLYSPILRGAGIGMYRDGQKAKLRVTSSTLLGGGMLA